MKSFTHIATAFLCEPWGIRPEAHHTLATVLHRHMSGEHASDEKQILAHTPRPALGEYRPQGDIVVGPCDENGEPLCPQMQKVGPIAIIPVFGVLGRHLSFMSLWCGGCDFTHVEQMAQLAEADPNIETIVFYFRSPGGMVVGCEETAATIAGLTKNTIAYSDEQCCSCAYWLAAACDQIIFSPSAIVANIGVFIAALDDSAQWATEGIKRELFRSGPLKAAGIEGKAWTDAERKSYQARVDSTFGEFKTFVASARPGVSEDAWSGAWYHGREAVALNLADAISPSLEKTLAAILS